PHRRAQLHDEGQRAALAAAEPGTAKGFLMRVAILGMGAIGHVIARALEGRAELVKVDRTRAPLRDDETPVDAAILATKTPGTAWAAAIAAKILAPDGVALTIQNGLGNYEMLVEHVGHPRAAVGVIYVGAQLVKRELRATGAGQVELVRPPGATPRETPREPGR